MLFADLLSLLLVTFLLFFILVTMEGCVNIITRLVLIAVTDIIAATETSYGGTQMLRMINIQRDLATVKDCN